MKKEIDILCVGEVLIDFIGHQLGAQISETRDYHRYLGGSPTNVAMNMARLGMKAALVAGIGDDGFGTYIMGRLQGEGVLTDYLKTIQDSPTSVIFVSRSEGTPDFIPYRAADCLISEDQINSSTLAKSRIFHTTAFALSKEPAQSTILRKAKEAADLGCTLSIDFNYAAKLWESKENAEDVIAKYCQLNPLIKISNDDMFRFFDKEVSHSEIFDFFLSLGAETICLTLGSEGVKLFQKDQTLIQVPAIKIDKIQDTTGAGDAFWSGFLFAYTKEHSMEKCLDTGLKLAALKLQNVGRLPENIDILSALL